MLNIGEILLKLEAERSSINNRLNAQGGRGVELANMMDRLQHAIDALNGDLYCEFCNARLVSGMLDLDPNE